VAAEPLGKVLLVDDEPTVLRGMARQLSSAGYVVETCADGAAAAELVKHGAFDVVISDIAMPGLDGIQLLRAVRAEDLDLPVILVTGAPAVQSAIDALEYGAFKYLVKPVAAEHLLKSVARAEQMYRLAQTKREALNLLGTGVGEADRAGLEASFERALASLWIAFQPIVRAGDRSIFGYEALLRSTEPSLPHPGAVLDAAERLNGLARLGRTVRERAAKPMLESSNGDILFVNLHPEDLLDPQLLDAGSALGSMAARVVLEITERSSLERVSDVRTRVKALRDLGFRIAVDDLGAGYAGLTSFAHLEPEIVKLDMTLVRDVSSSVTRQKLIRSMASVCKDMGSLVVAEGVETTAERDCVIDLGCDLLQGYLLAKPGPPFPAIDWPPS
jgi:EAL domain-containing protein (putative c-di-GMP-specific phosphodiesterase class I)